MSTTIQVSDGMRRKLKVLASHNDLSYDELLDDLVGVFEASIPFQNEAEFAEWFEDNLDKFGFEEVVKRRKTSSPDYRLRDADGNVREVEIELLGKHFIAHGHNPEDTDLIISLFSDKEEIEGVPVLSVISSEELKDEFIDRPRHDFTTVSIPKELRDEVDEFIEDTNFTSVGEFTKHLLRDTVGSGALHNDLTEEEVRHVRKRLKRLGYMEED